MKISNKAVPAITVVTAIAGLLWPASFGPARTVESTDTNRGNGDQTKTETASRSGLRFGRRKAIVGVASWYGGSFNGRRTASGERFNMNAMTLACRRLPMGTRVRVTNLRNGRSAFGRINDLGPNGRHRRRVADLSVGLARKIGFTPGQGITRVRLEVVSK